jgi:hypothetical protein
MQCSFFNYGLLGCAPFRCARVSGYISTLLEDFGGNIKGKLKNLHPYPRIREVQGFEVRGPRL